jgi:hypothetical protein
MPESWRPAGTDIGSMQRFNVSRASRQKDPSNGTTGVALLVGRGAHRSKLAGLLARRIGLVTGSRPRSHWFTSR